MTSARSFPSDGSEGARLPVDLEAACVRALERAVSPGTWWNGEERRAIALESRAAWSCELCSRRKNALSPEIAGAHDAACSPGVLPDVAIEAIHRVTTDPSRLSADWLRRLLASGLAEEKYVELIGVLTQVFSIDEQDRVLGLATRVLPDARPGEPSRRRPSGAKDGPGWVPTVAFADLDVGERDLYGERATRVGNVIRALSLVPDEVRALRELLAAQYVPHTRFFDMGYRRALDRAQIEWVAARVSALNECFY